MSAQTGTPESAAKNAIARLYKGNKVIGAGFLVEGGYVLTCAHVVRDVLALKAGEFAEGRKVKLNFPYVSLRQKWNAEVLLYRLIKGDEEQNEDIAGLRILEPLPVGILPVELRAGYELHSPYWVLGFPEKHVQGITSYGQLLKDLPNGWAQLEDTKNQGLAILPGFSGTPVWDEATDQVVGMVVAREKNTPEAKIGFMVPARSLIAVRRELSTQSLLSMLEGAAASLADLAESIDKAYQLSCPLRGAVPEELAEKLANLRDAKQGDSAFEAVDRFVALLSLPELNPDGELRERFRQWLESRVEDMSVLLAEVEPLLTKPEVRSSADVVSHLLIYVKDESGEARSVSALFMRDGREYDLQSGVGSERLQAPGAEDFAERVTLETLPQLVQACLKEALGKSPTNLTLHLMLPLAWLNEACDRWSFMDRAQFAFLPNVSNRVGVRFCCVMRITERLLPEILAVYEEPWREKWQKLLGAKPEGLCTAFVSADNLALETELVERLHRPASLGLKVSKTYQENQYPQVFGTLIATGTPAALWLRYDQFEQGLCATADLDKLLNCKIAKLPEQIKQARSQAMAKADNAHIGHHLSFLWEDPTLIPPRPLLGMP